MYRMKKTKIVATMSDFRCTEEFVKNLYDAGMDVVRVNSAHVTEDGRSYAYRRDRTPGESGHSDHDRYQRA